MKEKLYLADLEIFKQTTFTTEKKDKIIQFKVTESQRKAIKQMADSRGLNVSELILTLLQYEKEHNIIFNLLTEKRFTEGGE